MTQGSNSWLDALLISLIAISIPSFFLIAMIIPNVGSFLILFLPFEICLALYIRDASKVKLDNLLWWEKLILSIIVLSVPLFLLITAFIPSWGMNFIWCLQIEIVLAFIIKDRSVRRRTNKTLESN